ITEAKLHFYPFWVATVQAQTYFTGLGEDAEYSGRDGSGAYRNIRTVMKEESGSFEKLLEFSMPASKEIPLVDGVVGVSRNRIFFSHEYVERHGGVLHGAIFTRAEAEEMARRAAANELSKMIAREVVKVVSRNDEIQVNELALVYFPIWQVVYMFRGKRYHALIDASSSRVIDATYPPDIVEKAGYLGVAGAHAIGGIGAAVLLFGFGWLPAFTALTGFLAAAAGYVWRGVSPTRVGEKISE
ncbi:MAG: hypothetical protein NZ581_08975, partial [Candidatus Caldarchaeum sp.]|nr:hypothetical protein [Candidatus Caldarchaeum sp.]MDW8436305.1 hypothetical protein [Candidatus Caldarchaeum sp.]